MSSPPSTDLISWPDERSVGLSQNDFTRPWAPRNWDLNEGTYVWSASHGEPGSKIRFLNAIEVTGAIIERLSPATLGRALCCILISKLSDDHVVQAYESLKDIYAWQLALPAPAPQYVSTPAKRRVSKVTQREPAPFVLEE